MKIFLQLSIIAGMSITLLFAEGQQLGTEPNKDCTRWVEKCLKDFQSIKPGMTRHEVENKFTMDGGLQMVSRVRFSHPTCAYFMIDVEFETKRDPADQNRAIWGKDDRVTKISKPYIESPAGD